MLNSCLIALLGFTLSIGADFDLYFHRTACNCGRYIGTPFRSIRFTPNDSPASLFRRSCRIDSFGLTAMEADVIDDAAGQSICCVVPIAPGSDGVYREVEV